MRVNRKPVSKDLQLKRRPVQQTSRNHLCYSACCHNNTKNTDIFNVGKFKISLSFHI